MLRILISILLTFPAIALADNAARDRAANQFTALLDLRDNSGHVRQPKRALDLADAMSEPEFMMMAMAMTANPEVWLKAMEQAGAPGVPKNLAQVTDPAMIAEWFYASIDPQFQQAVVTRMFDPAKPQRWMQALSNPRFYMNALASMNELGPTQWMKIAADGRMSDPMRIWFDPQTYMNWMRLPMPQDKKGDTIPPAAHWSKPPQRY